jgi:sec-independent protein translocase protein TatA
LTRSPPDGTIRAILAAGASKEDSMFGMGPMELGIILVIVVVLFGARRLPEIGAGFGKAIKNFKVGLSGDDEIDVTPEKEQVDQGKDDDRA